MAKSEWVRVSKNSPCPACKEPDWCSVSADGSVAMCMRVSEGSFKSKEDRNGTVYYLHRLADCPRPDAPRPPRSPSPGAKAADADAAHEIYSALLERLALSEAHRENLRRRGLTDDAIQRLGYRSIPARRRSRIVKGLRERFGDRLLRVPGFVAKEGQSGRYVTLNGPAGLVVPCRDRAGRVVALKVRRDDAEGGPRYVYVSSAGQGGPSPGSPAHVPLGTPEACELLRVTEGELKADVIQYLTGVPTLSASGATVWRPCLDVLKALGCKTARLAFDADAADKPAVARALVNCAGALSKDGYAVELERWDTTDGKGLDDVLAAGKTPDLLEGDAALQAVREILAAASAGDEPPAADLARLHDVIESGGAEALFRDWALLLALAKLAEDDPPAFAAARASIRARVSVRDLDQAIRPFRRQSREPTAAARSPYFEQNGCVHRSVPTKDGPIAVALSNFTAKIVADVEHDDGIERSRYLALEGALANGRPLTRVEVAATDFPGMNWVVPSWGTQAVVYAGQGTKDHLRAALQLLSGDVPRCVVFRHVGWRQIGDAWFYLHAGGAIGADGLVEDIPVSLPEPLARFHLPAPPEGAELRDSVKASLSLHRLGPDHLTFPLVAAVYRAVLGDADFGLHVEGPTGSYKSEIAALAQQHFGPGLDARHLPASWSSTGNALEALAFAAKDSLLVVDDFCPIGSSADVQRYHKEADRLFRGQGNRSGRQRMSADISLRPSKPPRGLTLSTGEDTPRGQSLRARLLMLEVSHGDLGPQPPAPNPALTACQQDAAAGKYAAAMAGFIRWLAPRYGDIRGRLRAEMAELRGQAGGRGQHARTPGIVADLALGLRHFLDFAQDTVAISAAERENLWNLGWAALTEAAAAQGDHIAAAEPAGMFLRLLAATIASGSAHVADPNGDAPEEPQRWGWRPEEFYSGEETDTRYKPQGVRVGWLIDEDLYVEPDASFAAVQRFAREQGDTFAISAYTLRRRMKEKGLLATTDAARGKLTVRQTLQGTRRDVLHIASDALIPPAKTGPTGPEDRPAPGNACAPDSGSLAGNAKSNGEPAHEHAWLVGAGGPVGRKGRSATEKESFNVNDLAEQQASDWGDWQ
jgi:Domain of unknown function (DUF3854)/Domain of unknown function (DUF927)